VKYNLADVLLWILAVLTLIAAIVFFNIELVETVRAGLWPQGRLLPNVILALGINTFGPLCVYIQIKEIIEITQESKKREQDPI
jgi:hypothetical protein